MEIRFTAEQEAWRGEVRDFLDKELPPDKEFNHEFEEDPNSGISHGSSPARSASGDGSA